MAPRLDLQDVFGELGISHIDAAWGICRLVYHCCFIHVHFVATDGNGDTVLIDALVGGSSNDAGYTVASLANDRRSCGYEEALLLDNGGDAMLVHRDASGGNRWADPTEWAMRRGTVEP